MSASKFGAERNQKLLLELAIKPGNDICADCKARNPRWASHNLGIFICVNCATIHRKIGTHVTKVKSLTMDTWTKEQVDRMKEMGNLNSNAIYCPNEIRHPPPPMLSSDERDSELESYIRSKYEYKRFLSLSGTTASSPSISSTRPHSTPANQALNNTSSSSSLSASSLPRNTPSSAPTRSVSQPLTANPITSQRQVSQPLVNAPPRQQSLGALPSLSASSASQATSASGANAEAKGGVWNDLISLQAPSTSSSLPLQYSQSPMPTFNMSNPSFNPPNTLGMNGMNGLTPMNANPTGMSFSPFPQNISGMSMPGSSFQQQQQYPQFTQPNQFGQPQPQGMAYNLQSQQPMFTNQLQPQLQSPQPMFAPQPGQSMGMPQGHSPQPMSTTPQLPGPYMSPSPQIPAMQMMQQPQQMQPPQFGGMNPGMNGMSMNNGMGMNMGGMGGMGGFPQQSQMFTDYGQSAPFGAQGQQWGSM